MDEKKLLNFEFVENGFIVIFDENKGSYMLPFKDYKI